MNGGAARNTKIDKGDADERAEDEDEDEEIESGLEGK